MALDFPIFVSLEGNTCVLVGGGEYSADAAELLLSFGAKITVIAPELCPRLRALDEAGQIRHIPRKFFRGDTANCYLCVAASGDRNTNIAVSVECKARHVLVNVEEPAEYGTMTLPKVVKAPGLVGGFTAKDTDALNNLCAAMQKKIPDVWEQSETRARRLHSDE